MDHLFRSNGLWFCRVNGRTFGGWLAQPIAFAAFRRALRAEYGSARA